MATAFTDGREDSQPTALSKCCSRFRNVARLAGQIGTPLNSVPGIIRRERHFWEFKPARGGRAYEYEAWSARIKVYIYINAEIGHGQGNIEGLEKGIEGELLHNLKIIIGANASHMGKNEPTRPVKIPFVPQNRRDKIRWCV